MVFQIALAAVAILGGGIASLSGFGIASLLTPLLAVKTGISVAVAAAAIAHFFGTGLRFLLLRRHLNRQMLLSFGLTSAAGGLAGALLHIVVQSVVLTIVFGCLLVFAGITGLTGLADKIRFKGVAAWIAGGLSGLFGGLVGNQGGIRSAAMLGFNLQREQFVATATGIALLVDVARLPVYLVVQWDKLTAIWPYIVIATVGVVVGTIGGRNVLRRLPELAFKRVVGGIILAIGVLVLVVR